MVMVLSKGLDLRGFKEYLETRVKQHSLSEGTVATYMGALVQFDGWLSGRELVRELCQDYIDKLTLTGKSNSTVATAAHAIKRYLRWKGIFIDIEYPSVRMLTPKYLTVEQVEMLLDECKTPLEFALVRLLFDTGARIAEIANIKVSEIDWAKGTAKVVRKGGHEGAVIMQPDTLKFLTGWLNARKGNSDNLFMNIGKQALSNVLRKVGTHAGMVVTPHMLRHARAIQMLEAGADMWAVQQVLGHLDIRTTMNVYGKFMPEHLRKHVPDPFEKAVNANGRG